MNNKKRTSLKTLILLPVFILGALTIICNVMAINNIRTVNSNAADITDNCMMSVSDLGEKRMIYRLFIHLDYHILLQQILIL